MFQSGGFVCDSCWFGQSEVSDSDLAISCDQNVLRLDVTVDNSVVVQVLQRFRYFRNDS